MRHTFTPGDSNPNTNNPMPAVFRKLAGGSTFFLGKFSGCSGWSTRNLAANCGADRLTLRDGLMGKRRRLRQLITHWTIAECFVFHNHFENCRTWDLPLNQSF